MKHTSAIRRSVIPAFGVSAVICSIYFYRLHSGTGFSPPHGLVASGIPRIPDGFRKSVARYQDWNSTAFMDWTADGGSMVAITRCGQTNQVCIVDAKNAPPRQITFGSEPVTDVSVCPDPSRRSMIFTKDSGGNEEFRLFAADLDGGRPRLLTGGQRSQNNGAVWSNAGDRFAYESNARNGVDFDICISDLKTSRIVLARQGSWSCLDWSPDDGKLLVERFRSRTESTIAVLDLKSGLLMPLSGTGDTVSQECGVWAQGGRGIFLTSDEGSSFRSLRYYDFATRRQTTLTGEIQWDVREVDISRDRSLLAFMTNENGCSRLYLMDAVSHAYREIPGLPSGGIYHLRFDAKATWLGMSMNLSQHPEECYAVRLADFACVRRTGNPLCGLDTNDLTVPRLIHYPTFDSVDGKPRMVPCFMYVPRRCRQGHFPVLIMVHGGPESQFWPYFSPVLQYFVNELGVSVLAPNIRGSGGYGRRYLELDNGYRREDAVRDIGCLLDWIARQDSLDSSRVGIMGGSYGGYMALSSMIRFGGRISCGIDLYGISNFVTFLEHTSAYRRDLRRVEYGDERDPEMRVFLNAISPLSRAARIARPLFIIQGANDPRVPLEESLAIAKAAKNNKSPVWTLVAPDEGHGYRKKANIDYQECAEAFFLRTFLARP